MSDQPPNAQKSDQENVTANVKLSSPDWSMDFKLTVPAGPTTLKEILPLAQSLSEAVVNAASHELEQRGVKISCCKGCGACCRQLVPVAEVEARRLAELVEAMPEPRRSQIKARFDDALRRFDEAGLLEKLHDVERWHQEGCIEFGMEYFRQGVPCPFLEDESCSIHPDRPLKCREFLVTSPAINCQTPTAETVQSVMLPLRVAPAVAEFQVVETSPHLVRWVPLILALEWGATHPDPPATQTGPEILSQLIDNMTGTKPPLPDDPKEASTALAHSTSGLMGVS